MPGVDSPPSGCNLSQTGTLLSVQVRDYMYQLEAHLAEVHRQAQRLIRQQASLGGALAEFGESMLGLGKFESGPLADGFSNLGAKADTLARASQARRRRRRCAVLGMLLAFMDLAKQYAKREKRQLH